MSKKAFNIEEVDQAVKFNEVIAPDHEFFTDFSGLRGEFEDRIVYRNMNVTKRNGLYQFNTANNSSNKSLLFLGGMRGSGKTSELAKYAKNLHNPECFYCITCNIDVELDINELEYMDILILQLEKLTQKLAEDDVNVDSGIKDKMQKWFSQREIEIKKELKSEAGIETEVGVSTKNPFFNLLSIVAKFKASVTGSMERADVTRKNLKNNFINFANIFNEYIEEVNVAIREENRGKEVLFIVDGLEKTMSSETRRKIIIEEQNRIEKIKAYTIFTLPIELISQRPNLTQFSTVECFPFVKISERDGTKNEDAYQRFREFVYKRIDKSIFAEEDLVNDAIYYSGGSPRQLLQILEISAFFVEDDATQINRTALQKGLQRLANQTSQFVEMPMIDKLKQINENNAKGIDTPYDEILQKMLENLYVLEYNSGTYKRPNPILELTNLYKQYVAKE
ncbi:MULTISPECIES: hypothetical protein [Chryseobacterium]|uniref:ATP-binding protein n=1 Tax=Candidatus Chryseobacterium massiliense TaxID=204089 RepID=A0A3D9BGZ0_9FLAO|nr:MULTISPECIES: hypothetical protein [Chryseobacterium]REC52662.1 hypothetical protein DRF68_02755 [Candidatus Chryseobacterium massiliae]